MTDPARVAPRVAEKARRALRVITGETTAEVAGAAGTVFLLWLVMVGLMLL